MDLARVCDEAAAAMVGRIETVLTHVGAAGGMFPLRIGDESEDVRFVKEIARAAGHLTAPVDAKYDKALRDLMASRFHGDPELMSGSQAAALIEDMVRAMTPSYHSVEEDVSHLAERV